MISAIGICQKLINDGMVLRHRGRMWKLSRFSLMLDRTRCDFDELRLFIFIFTFRLENKYAIIIILDDLLHYRVRRKQLTSTGQ